MPTSCEWSRLQFQVFLDLNSGTGDSGKAVPPKCSTNPGLDSGTFGIQGLDKPTKLERILLLKHLSWTLGILIVLKDQTNVFYLIFSGGAALPESPVQLFKSRNAWSCSRCHSELVGMLLATQYRHSGGSQERERTSNSCRTAPHGGRQSCLCSCHCPQKSCHWPTKQRTHRWVKSMFFQLSAFIIT